MSGVRVAGGVERQWRHPQTEVQPGSVHVTDEVGPVGAGRWEACRVEVPVPRHSAGASLPGVVEHEALHAQRAGGVDLMAQVQIAHPRPPLPRMEGVESHAARKGGCLVSDELTGEGRRRLLGAAVVYAEVGAPQVKRGPGADRALADGGGIGRVVLAVVAGRVGLQRPVVKGVTRMIDADPGTSRGFATHPTHESAAPLADQEPAGARAIVEASHLSFVVEDAGGLGHHAVVVAPVRSAVICVHLGTDASRGGQLVEGVGSHPHRGWRAVEQARRHHDHRRPRMQRVGAVEFETDSAHRGVGGVAKDEARRRPRGGASGVRGRQSRGDAEERPA